MRHRVKGRGLGRSPSHRRAMIRNMVTSLLEVERIETTDGKAKEIKPITEKIITLGKRGDLHARRRALKFVRKRDVVAKVFSELAERFRDRPGGYTRITKLGRRHGDGAEVSILELLPASVKAAAPGKRTRRLRRGGKKSPEATPAEAEAPKKEEVPRKEAPPKKEAAPKKETKKAPPKKKAEPKKAEPKKAKEAPAKAKAKPKKKEEEKAAKPKKAKEKPAEKKAPAKKKTAKAPAKKTKTTKTTKSK